MEPRYATLEEIHDTILPLTRLNKRALCEHAYTLLELYLSFMQVVKNMTWQYAVKYGFDKQLKDVRVSFRGRRKVGINKNRICLGLCYYTKGVISINPVMILGMPDHTRQVILHELCHFKIHGHPRRFYILLEDLMHREQVGYYYPFILSGRRSEEFMWMIKEVYDYYKKKKQKEERTAAKLGQVAK